MSDIIVRLLGYGGNGNPLAEEAATEIKQLRALLEQAIPYIEANATTHGLTAGMAQDFLAEICRALEQAREE